MLDEFSLRRLRFLVLPSRFPDEQTVVDLNRAYTCWKEVWSEALKVEMNVKDTLYSDNFSRQSHVAVLFCGQEPVGLTTLNVLNLKSQQDLDDSFFRIWPEAKKVELIQTDSRIMTCCNVTLNFRYRRGALGVSGKDLLLAMLVHFLKSTNVDSILAEVRLEKGMEKASYRTGAECLVRNIPYTIPGQFVDIVRWDRNLDMNLWDPDIRGISSYVWNKSSRVISHVKQGEIYAA